MSDKSERIATECEEVVSAHFEGLGNVARFTPSIRHGVRYIALETDDGGTYLIEINVEKS